MYSQNPSKHLKCSGKFQWHIRVKSRLNPRLTWSYCSPLLVFSRYLSKLVMDRRQIFSTFPHINLTYSNKRKLDSSCRSSVNDVKMTSCFLCFRQQQKFVWNTVTKVVLNIELVDFLYNMDGECVSQIIFWDSRNLKENWKGKRNQQRYFQKYFKRKKTEFQKHRILVKETCLP